MAAVTDLFERTASGTLGTADTGQLWTFTGNTGNLSLDGHQVVMACTSGATDIGSIETAESNTEVTVDFTISAIPTGTTAVDSYQFSAIAKFIDNNNYVAGRFEWLVGDAQPTLSVTRRVAGVLTVFGALQPWPTTFTPGDVWRIKLRCQGSDILARTWRPGTDVEPTAWLAVGVDTSPPAILDGAVGWRRFTTNTLSVKPTLDIAQFTMVELAAPEPPNADITTHSGGVLFGLRTIIGDSTTMSPTPESNPAQTIGVREAELGRPIDIVMTFRDWDSSTYDMDTEFTYCTPNGRIPMISWPLDTNTPSDVLTEVPLGTYDGILDTLAGKIAAVAPARVMFRLVWEMNIDAVWGIDPNAFIASWRHIYDRFQLAGATNAEFIWAPNHRTDSTGGGNLWDDYYPGEDYLHWIGMDSYNKNPTTQFLYALFTSGDFFQTTQNHDWYHRYLGRTRSDGTKVKLMIAETGCREQWDPNIVAPNTQPFTKEAWLDQALLDLKAMPSIDAFTYFDVNAPQGDYRLDTSPSGAEANNPTATNPTFAAFKALVNDPYVYLGSTTVTPPPPPPPNAPTSDIFDRIRRAVSDYPAKDVLAASMDVGDTTISATNPGVGYAPGHMIVIDEEAMLITSGANGTDPGATFNVLRGWMGTQAAVHNANTPVLIGVRFAPTDILDAMNEGMAMLWPYFFKWTEDTSLFVQNQLQADYPLPAAFGQNGIITSMEILLPALPNSQWSKFRWFKHREGADGRTLQLIRVPPVGTQMRLLGISPFTAEYDFTGVTPDTQMSAHAQTSIVLYSKYVLKLVDEAKRQNIATAKNIGPAAVQGGQNSGLAQIFYQQWLSYCQSHAQRYPTWHTRRAL